MAWQFLRKDYIPDFILECEDGKFYVYLWLMAKENVNSIDALVNPNLLLRLHEKELSKLSEMKDLETDIQKYVDTITFPSVLSKWAHLLNRDFEPKFRAVDVRQQNGSSPSIAVISYLNFISPQLTGYLLENVLWAIIKNDLTNLSAKDIPDLSIQLIGDEKLPLTDESKQMILSQFEIKDEKFASIYDKYLYMAVCQYFEKCITLEKYEDFWRLSTAKESTKKHFELYCYELEGCCQIKGFQRKFQESKNKDIHSVKVSGKWNEFPRSNLRGEIDFIFPEHGIILDAKCVKNPVIAEWFYQLSIYEALYGSANRFKLQIFNFLENKLYEFQ